MLGRLESNRRPIRLLRVTSASILDQCFFTGTNFLTSVFVGKLGGEDELGVYTLVFSLVMLAIALQRTLLITPYVVIRDRLASDQRSQLRGTMLFASVSVALAFLAIGGVVIATGYWLVGLATAAVGAGLVRDFVRRLGVADLQVNRSLVIDATTCVAQLGLLFVLFHSQARVSAENVLLFVCPSWLIIGGAAYFFQSQQFAFVRKMYTGHLRDLWQTGRWVGLNQLLSTCQAYTMPWLLATCHSLKLAGAYAACGMLVQVTSPIIEGIGGILGPALAKAVARRDRQEMRSRIALATTVYAGLSLAVVVVLSTFGDVLLSVVFGPVYRPYYGVLVLIGLAATFNNLGIPATKALTQLGKASSTSLVVGFVFLGSILSGYYGLSWIGMIGPAIALCSMALIGCISRWSILTVSWQKFAWATAPETRSAQEQSVVEQGIGHSSQKEMVQ